MFQPITKLSKFIMIIVCIIVSIIILFLWIIGICVLKDWDKYGIEPTLWFSESKKVYSDGGFGDFINYGEYTFNDKSIRKFKNNKWYKQVEENDIDNIKSYFENYEEFVSDTDFAEKYSFDKDVQINKGDYYYIYTLEGKPIGNSKYRKFDNYDVYYVDIETKTVYYIHANI